MNISVDHSTPKCGLSATRQAARESGASQKIPSGVQITQQKPENEYPLRIEQLPPALQWWKEEHFWLFHVETGLRVPGTWSLNEAELIQDLSRQWDWRVDKDRRVACGLQLSALAEAICKRSSHQIGGEA